MKPIKSIILVDTDVQDEEFIYPYYRLQEEGPVEVATPRGEVVKGKYGVPCRPTMATENLGYLDDYDLVVIPGGWAAERMRMNKDVLHFVRDAHDAGKIIGAICHGPQVLISASLCKGRKMTCYQGMKDDLINAGAAYVEAGLVTDGNIITAPHYRNNPEFVRAMINKIV